ncbi:MAG: glycosyltransferase [Desulfuromonadales bacterium]|jgi:spore maturation protein CgeB
MSGQKIVILGLSITSSWGNGHATTYRGLVRELGRRGHDVLFLERDVPWYAGNRDLPAPPGGRTVLYDGLAQLRENFAAAVRDADMVIVGSYLPQGTEVARWVLATARGVIAFYDIDTPITLAMLATGDAEYLSADLIPRFDLYLSFTGGPTLRRLEQEFGARRARSLYCSVDPEQYFPQPVATRWDFGYLGTYSADRQPPLESLLLGPARHWPEGRFVVAGAQFPLNIPWPANVERIDHLPPLRHRNFYNAQRFTLNLTRADMLRAGWSPSVRLFEAASCGTAIISDWWPGLDSLFEPGREILIAQTPEQVQGYLRDMPEAERLAIGRRGRRRILNGHTAAHRAAQLEEYLDLCRASLPYTVVPAQGAPACQPSIRS